MVERFTITAAEQDPWIDADPSGQWVRYSDYAALEDRPRATNTADANETADMSDKPTIRVEFECFDSGITGSTEAKVKRVEVEDDGSFTVVIDHWPVSEGQQEPVASGVRVKALEWTLSLDGWWRAEGVGFVREILDKGRSPEEVAELKAEAQADYERIILSALEPSTPEGQQPVAEALELSGNTGELIDKMAEAIRGDTVSDDTPWATLSEDRKIGWRGDAERALAVVKGYLTTRRPSEQAVTEAMVEAAAKSLRPDLFTPIKDDVLQSDDYALTCRRNAKIDVVGKARAALSAALASGESR